MNQLIHSLPAGVLPGDSSIELFADRNAQELHYFESGKRKSFNELPDAHKKQLHTMLMGDRGARKAIGHLPYEKAVHAYAYCLWGAADACADFTADGALQAPDNFRCNIEGCTCNTWDHKKIRYNEHVISGRELQVLDYLATDLTDEAIAGKLFITRSTLNSHKKNLFIKLNVHSTPALLHIAAVSKYCSSMISQETARKIHNCHSQIESGKKLIEEMKSALKTTGEPKLEDAFGGRRDLELGVPHGSSGHRIFGVRFDLGVKIIKSHIKDQKKILKELKGVAELELTETKKI